jgi:hypothetical protein
MGLTLREERDEDLPLLFEQWADPVAAQMAAFTAPDHMDRDAFERRWSRLRADETVLTKAIVADDEVAGTIGSWGEPGERATGSVAPTGAKGSRFIVVAGPTLEEPVILDDWPENLKLLTATLDEGAAVAPGSLASRPFLNVALLWGPWTRGEIDRIGAGKIAERGRGGDNDDRFYPAVDGKKAVVAIYLADRPGPREAGPTVLDILTRHGIPVALPVEASSESWWSWITAGVVGGAAFLLGAALVVFRRRVRPSPA